MQRRYVSIWFRHLVTDWISRRQPELRSQPFVIVAHSQGRLEIVAANEVAENFSIYAGMSLADARALEPTLQTFDEKPNFSFKLLDALADWLIRYTPSISIDEPDGLMLDVTGCPHLLGGEKPFLKDLVTKLRGYGYDARAAMADTQGAAWAVARYGQSKPIVPSKEQKNAIAELPPAALRIDSVLAEQFQKLGIRKISDLYPIPRASLSRRFGAEILLRLDQALGDVQELIRLKRPIAPYEERMEFPDGLASPEGIAEVIKKLLARMCERLQEEGKGIRSASLQGVRLDGIVEQISIGTSLPNRDTEHLFKLFEEKIEDIEPALGIELFILTAHQLDEVKANQNGLLEDRSGHDETLVPELIDKIANRIGSKPIKRFLSQAHYWPERSVKPAFSLQQKADTEWEVEQLRPIRLLKRPEPIEAMSPVPDYPPLQFRYNGRLHRVRKADGPERIEREWWMDRGPPRDYYRVEDEKGHRYWVFRSGHFKPDEPSKWFLHGFFA